MTAALSAFASPQALVPGDLDGLDDLRQTLLRYADGAAGAAEHVRTLQAGSWIGPAADAFRERIRELPRRLDRGADAFADAARALGDHTAELCEARRDAASAIDLMADADAATAAWHARAMEEIAAAARSGPVLGRTTSGPLGPDPGEPLREQVRRILASARERVDEQGERSAALLRAAEEHAPDKPGLFERALGQVGQFFAGAAEATVDLLEFGFKLSPTYLLIDPDGFVEHTDGLVQGLVYGAQNPREFAKAVLDWETWKENPARALGHLVPDLLLTVATAGGGAAARGSRAARSLDEVADMVSAGAGRVPPLSPAVRRQRLAELGYDSATPAGRAADFQLDHPYGGIDAWVTAPRPVGTRVVFGSPHITGFGIPVDDSAALGGQARRTFEGVQAGPMRMGPHADPTYRPHYEVYELT